MVTLAAARLEPAERRVLDRLVDLLRDEYGPDLHGVWLYGSRARGERTGPESDIDLMVITAEGRRDSDRSTRLLHRAADEVNGNPGLFSLHSYDHLELARERGIESFFLKEVDRDRVVVFGDGNESILDQGGENLPSSPLEGKMRPRSERFMEMARRRLAAIQLFVEHNEMDGAVEPAYYASFNAARAALSEEDLYAKTHSGQWDLFHQTFVATGRFDAELAARARSAQEPREKSAYEGVIIEATNAREIVATAERFVAAVEAMFK